MRERNKATAGTECWRTRAARSGPCGSTAPEVRGENSAGAWRDEPAATPDAQGQGEPTVSDAYIVGAVRTAVGRRNGKLKNWHPIDLGATVLDELLQRTSVDPATIEDVIFGCVDQVGAQAANVARNCVLSSSLPESVPATTVDRQCGSSQQAVHFAAQAV